jgi:hypothetical protein
MRIISGGVLVAVLGLTEGCAASQPSMPRLTPGKTVEARISSDAPLLGDTPFRSFRFQANAGERYLVTALGEAISPYLRIGRNIAGVTDFILAGGGEGTGSRVAYLFTPKTSGEYLIVLNDTEGRTGNFSIAVTRAGDASQPLTIGEPMAGNLTVEAIHRFRATRGTQLVITARSREFDTVLEVGTITEEGVFIPTDSDDDGGDGLNSRLWFVPPVDGMYALRVTGYGESGGSYMVLVSEPGPAADPTVFQPETTVGGELTDATPLNEEGSPVEDWALQTEANVRYRVSLWSNDFDTYLIAGRMEAGRFVELDTNDDARAGDLGPTDSRLFVTGTGSPMLFRVRAYSSDERGRYSLEATRVPDARLTPVVTDLAPGESHSAELTQSDAILPSGHAYREYRIRATAGERLEVVLHSDEFDAWLGAGLGSGPSMTELFSDDDGAGNGTDARLVFSAPTTGEYTIRVRAYGSGGTGRYTIRAARLPQPRREPVVETITFGQTRTGELTDVDALLPTGHSYREYRFRATAGQRVDIRLSSDDFDTWVAVGLSSGPDMAELFSNDDGGNSGTDSRLAFAAPIAGEYTIRVRAYSASSKGRYSISLSEVPPPPAVRRLEPGVPVSDLITDLDRTLSGSPPFHDWTFQAKQGDTFVITLESEDFDTVVEVGRSSSGYFAVLDSNDDSGDDLNSRLTFIAPEDGAYTVRARPYSNSSRGVYTLTLRRRS